MEVTQKKKKIEKTETFFKLTDYLKKKNKADQLPGKADRFFWTNRKKNNQSNLIAKDTTQNSKI